MVIKFSSVRVPESVENLCRNIFAPLREPLYSRSWKKIPWVNSLVGMLYSYRPTSFRFILVILPLISLKSLKLSTILYSLPLQSLTIPKQTCAESAALSPTDGSSSSIRSSFVKSRPPPELTPRRFY